MAFVPLPNTAQVVWDYQFGAERVANVVYVAKAAPLTLTDLNTIASVADAWHTNNARQVQSTVLTLIRILVTDMTTQFSPGIELPVTPGRVGLVGGDSLPGNVTVATTFITSQRGRAFRGRAYWCGMAETQTNGNGVVTAALTAITAAWTAFAGLLSPGAYTHVVASRQLNNVPRVTGVSTPITAYRTEANVDSQRRRLALRGR